MRHVLSILFGACFTLFACWASGKLFLARYKLAVFAEELQIFRFAVGAGLFSLLVLLLAAANLARTEVFLIVGALVILLSFRVREERLRLPDFSNAWKFLFILILLGFGVFYFVNALAPEVSPDGSTYHLGLVARYFQQHGLGHITTSIYANLSEGLEMLFLSAFSIGRHSAAALIEFAFLLALPPAMVAYSQRFAFTKAGVAAAAMVFCSPVFGISGSSAYNDAAGVFILFCLFYVLQIWDSTRQTALLVVAGLLAGFSYGVKYSLFLATPYCLGFVAWKLYRSRQPILKPLLIAGSCAAVLIAPWWIKNWVVVGNPISPFGNRIFSNPYVTPRFESDYVKSQSSQVPAVNRFIEAAIHGGTGGGFLGPLFLLSPLALFAVRYRQGRQALLATAVFLVPAVANTQTRFLMPAVPFLALALCLAVMKSRGILAVFAWAAPILAIPAVADIYCDPWAWRLHQFPFADAMRSIPERESLNRRLEGFQTAELINKYVPPRGKVFTTSVPKEAYLTREDIVAYESAPGETLSDMLMVAVNPDFQPSWILTFHFPETQLRRIRVLQTANGKDDDEWSIAEIKLFHAGQQRMWLPQWHFHSNANPWDAAYAFDQDPLTRWRSRIALFAGMWMDLDLERLQTLDEVELDCSHDQYSIRLRLEGDAGAGHWTKLADAPTANDRMVRADLRKAAIDQFKKRGITDILLNKGDYVAADFQKNETAWGVVLAGRAGDDCLYAIK